MSNSAVTKSDDLSSQQCVSMTADTPALDVDHAMSYLQQLEPQWTLDIEKENISHTFIFKNYYHTMAFVNVVAHIAHQQDHHPDMLVSYNRCTVTYSTHSVAGLSLNDFICAAKINAAQNL